MSYGEGLEVRVSYDEGLEVRVSYGEGLEVGVSYGEGLEVGVSYGEGLEVGVSYGEGLEVGVGDELIWRHGEWSVTTPLSHIRHDSGDRGGHPRGYGGHTRPGEEEVCS